MNAPPSRTGAGNASRPNRQADRLLPVFRILERLHLFIWKLAVWKWSILWPWRKRRPRVLVVQPDHMGDFLVGLSPMQEVYDEYRRKGFAVDILVSPANAALAKACPLFDGVLSFDILRPDFSNWSRYRLYCRLYSARYSAVVNLQYFPGSGRKTHPLAVLCRAPFSCTVMNTVMSPIRMTPWDRHFRIDRWRHRYSLFLEDRSPSAMLAAHHLAECIAGRKLPLRLYTRGFGKLPEVPLPDAFYVVAPGAFTRQPWPMDRFAELMERLHRKWPDLVPVLTGGGREKALGEEIRRLLPPDMAVLDMIGRTSTLELLSILRKSRFVVSNDAGTAHAAPLLDVPSLVVSGAWHPGVYQPNPLYTKTICLLHPMDCAGCSWEKCPHPANGIDACLAAVSVEQAACAVERLMSSPPAPFRP